MAFLFAKKRQTPERVPTDDVVPVHFFDDNNVYRAIIVDFSLRFDDVLDHEKLRSALVRLMEIGNWRKLGARLRLNGESNLEYHIPASYDEKRPGFAYSHVEYAVKIGEHPIASKFPRATSRPSIAANIADFRPLTRAPDAPKTFDDFLYSDRPQLSVYIVSFEDATLVSLCWPHTFLDAMGRVALFKNWIAVLDGREEDVQPLYGFDVDPLATLGTKPTEPSLIARWQLVGISFFFFVLRYIFEIVWHRKEEARIVCLPGPFVQYLKQESLKDLTDGKSHNKPFLSDGDVICAWWFRALIYALEPEPNRTVAVMNAFGMRKVLSNDLLPTGCAYVSNASMVVHTFFTANDVYWKPLSYAASKIREGISLQGTREQLEAFVSLVRESRGKTGRGPVFGDPGMILVVFSNWTAAKFYELDLSSAVIRQGLPIEERSNAIGKPSYINADGQFRGVSPRNGYFITGKDAGGNYWLGGVARAEVWPKIEKRLAAL